MVDKARLMIRNITSLLAMVRANAGVTLLPALACTTLPAGLTALEIETGGVSRVVGLIQRSNSMPSPLATTFVKQLNEQLREVLSHSIGLYLVMLTNSGATGGSGLRHTDAAGEGGRIITAIGLLTPPDLG